MSPRFSFPFSFSSSLSPQHMSQDRASLAQLKSDGHHHYVDEASISDCLLCPVCQEPLVDPVVDTLEHAFCLACAQDCLKHNKACPIGREPLSWQSAPRMIRNMLDELLVKCLHEECDFQGPRETLLNHLKGACPYELVSCACAHQCERRLIESHLDEACPRTLIACAECRQLVARNEMQSHLETDNACPVTTARRAEKQRREELEREQAKLEERFALLNPPQADMVHIDTTRCFAGINNKLSRVSGILNFPFCLRWSHQFIVSCVGSCSVKKQKERLAPAPYLHGRW